MTKSRKLSNRWRQSRKKNNMKRIISKNKMKNYSRNLTKNKKRNFKVTKKNQQGGFVYKNNLYTRLKEYLKQYNAKSNPTVINFLTDVTRNSEFLKHKEGKSYGGKGGTNKKIIKEIDGVIKQLSQDQGETQTNVDLLLQRIDNFQYKLKINVQKHSSIKNQLFGELLVKN